MFKSQKVVHNSITHQVNNAKVFFNDKKELTKRFFEIIHLNV